MVIDSFPFCEELLILESRLHELNEVVDYHILIEANRTQTRLEKPFYYLENKHLFEEFNHKIISVQLEDYIPGGMADWSMEKWQRNQILTGLDKLQKEKNIRINSSDTILISDIDEYPSAQKLKEVLDSNINLISFNHYSCCYYLNLKMKNRGWYGTVLCNLGKMLEEKLSPQFLRSEKDRMRHTSIDYDSDFSGWHFSSLLYNGFDSLWSKFKTRIEPHNKFCVMDKNKLELKRMFENQVINNKEKFFFYVDAPENLDTPLEYLDINELPLYIQNNIDKYQHLILPPENYKDLTENI